LREKSDNKMQVADFLVDYATDIVLIEAKGGTIPDKLVSWNTSSDYLDTLRERYVEQGCAQLARTISKLSTGEWNPAGIDISQAQRVFPLLVAHDNVPQAHLHAHFLAGEFRDRLQPDSSENVGWMVKGRFRVAPLTALTIDDLERLESSLGKFSLLDILRAYSDEHPDRRVSFRNFVAGNPDRFPMVHNKNLASTCERMLCACLRRFFPGTSGRQSV
ncbi:MAG: hypothetical protein RDV41_11795, partial [Planctomycetota bacterium]|nr:hypothetical protein [Planctomycetota bacterium]